MGLLLRGREWFSFESLISGMEMESIFRGQELISLNPGQKAEGLWLPQHQVDHQ